MSFAESHPDGVLLHVCVLPRASRSGIAEVREDDVRVRLQSPPLDGRANKELIQFMAEHLNCSKRSIQLLNGKKNRNKTLLVQGLSPTEIQESFL